MALAVIINNKLFILQYTFLFTMIFLSMPFAGVCLFLSIRNDYFFAFNLTHSSVTMSTVSFFIFPRTNLSKFSQYFDLVK